MPFSRKSFVAGAFLQRLLIIAPIIARLHYLHVLYHSNDPTLNVANSTICKEVEMAFGIIATSIPCLRPLLNAMATNYGAPPKTQYARNPYATGSNSGKSKQAGDTFALQKLKQTLASVTSSSSKSRRINKEHSQSLSGNQFYASTVKTTPREESSLRSGASQDMIIRKDVDYDVQYYDKNIEEGDAGPSTAPAAL